MYNGLRKGAVLWHITASLDDFVAAPDGSVAIFKDFVGPNPMAQAVLAHVGVILAGPPQRVAGWLL